MTYAKIISIGDWSPYGIPVTLEPRKGERHVIMLEPAQCIYFRSRLEAVIATFPKEEPIQG